MEVKDIIEQNAIFDGEPDFLPFAACLYLLNHNSFGGTPKDFKEAKEELDNPRRYRVRLTLEYEDITGEQQGEKS